VHSQDEAINRLGERHLGAKRKNAELKQDLEAYNRNNLQLAEYAAERMLPRIDRYEDIL
jgi:hypothetical protein